MESYQADPARVALGNSGSTAKAVSLNSGSALILDTQGTVWALGPVVGNPATVWHDTRSLVQGLPAVQQLVNLDEGSFALDASGTIWAWGRDVDGWLWE